MARKTRSGDLASGATLLIIGLCLIVPSLLHSGLSGLAKGDMALGGLICAGLGLVKLGQGFFRSRQLPQKEVMRLAEQRGGLLTLSEITTGLDIDPDRARRTLQALSKSGIAHQRWEEYRKNLWEFPDYMKLPITQSIELAKARGGRLTVNDLVSAGHTRETARQTLDTLNEKGLAQEDPAGPRAGDDRSMIVTTQ